MATNVFFQGAELLLYGMGTVVIFLVVLIGAMQLLSWITLRFLPEPEKKLDVLEPITKVDKKVIAAIGAAIGQLRSRDKNSRP